MMADSCPPQVCMCVSGWAGQKSRLIGRRRVVKRGPVLRARVRQPTHPAVKEPDQYREPPRDAGAIIGQKVLKLMCGMSGSDQLVGRQEG